MPDATELFSTTQLKTMLNITGSSQDALITLVKASVEQFVKTYCGRDLLVASYTEFHDGDDGNLVRTIQRPIVSITSIHSDPARLFGDAALIPSSDIVDDSEGQRLGFIELLTYKFLKGVKSTKIVYSAGYSTVPGDLSYAALLIAAKQFHIASKQMFAENSREVGDLRITLSVDTFPRDAMEVIDRYKRAAGIEF